ncbi:MAG: isoprenylcysteine carboxylmethyltransferase family protein [Deltaproteobacteria bacterium]|nr:isoprenylcysteine carboxylmethyltransferase family protein [Deltaproteobacteria bacterium]MBW2121540.1 isoprenylcysteine carboxylmethyltransferase family protein [Deltaproteobacteria bacterium]
MVKIRERLRNPVFLQAVKKSIFVTLLTMLTVFLAAGRLTYWQGWLYIGILLGDLSAVILFVPIDLLHERMKPGPGRKRWDKILVALLFPLSYSVVVVASLDAGRYGEGLSLSPYGLGMVLLVYGFSSVISIWSMLVNPFFSSVMRIQADRGHQVISKGPYSVIRHPGYLGEILGILATPLLLGSLWGLVPAGAVSVLIGVRAYLEDTTLRRELEGYEEYTQEVRYRLLPGIW